MQGDDDHDRPEERLHGEHPLAGLRELNAERADEPERYAEAERVSRAADHADAHVSRGRDLEKDAAEDGPGARRRDEAADETEQERTTDAHAAGAGEALHPRLGERELEGAEH